MGLEGYRAIVIGAGISGLAAAYMLARHNAEVFLLEKDGPPPEDPEEAFRHWTRPGATQIRHSHVFLGRLRVLLRDAYPELLSALLQAGMKEMRPLDRPPPALRGISPEPGDEDLVALAGRRVTFECVLRRCVAALPNVKLLSGIKVTGLLGTPTDPPHVTGVRFEGRAGEKRLRGHFVVDASGRHSAAPRWLAGLGCRPIPEKQEDSGIVYYTRFYRLRPGAGEPQPGKDPWVADWDWIKFAVFPAEDGTFSITLAIPRSEPRLKVLAKPQAFDAMIREIPGVSDWIDPCVAMPLENAPHGVEAMGGLINRRRRFVDAAGPIVLRLFVIGDAAYCTNPLYGRGCAQAFLHAHALVNILERTLGDWYAAALALDQFARENIEPFVRASVVADRDATRRALRHEPSRMIDKFQDKFFREGVAVAMRTDPVVFRAFLRMINMFETPEQAFLRPEVVARTLWVMAQGEAYRRRHGWRPPPEKSSVLDRLQASLGH